MRALDTNVVIALLSGRRPHARQRFRACISAGESMSLPAVALFELRYGIEKSSRREANAATLDNFLARGIDVPDFTDEDARVAAVIRTRLEMEGRPIGPYDILIAAQALARNAILVTANVREFSRIAGLTIEDWTADS
jgi:tRNA(fMet)-specific endonuclease VapC